MIRPLRRAHRWLLPVVAVVVGIAVAIALVRRPALPSMRAWPPAVKDDLSPRRGAR